MLESLLYFSNQISKVNYLEITNMRMLMILLTVANIYFYVE